jgi:hypothetical protein
MKAIKHPIRNTIFYGMFCGLSFVPLSLGLSPFIEGPGPVCLTLWLFFAGYAMLLVHWGHKALRSIVLPLLLLVPPIFLGNSLSLFFVLALIVLSWIRSGVCFQKTGVKGLVAELLLCILGVILLQAFHPGTLSAWAIGVWLLFLVQALYFVFFEHSDRRRLEPAPMDAFERASRQADRILTDIHFH